MSVFSETREAFRTGSRDYDGYDRDYESRYRRGGSRDDYEEPEDEEYYDDEEESGNPIKNFFERRRRRREERLAEEEAEARAEEERAERRSASRSSIRYSADRPGETDVEMVVFYPQTIDESDRIVEAVQSGKLAIFIFEFGEDAKNGGAFSDGTARRIVDYVGGAAKGMNCGFGRLSNGIFCIAPKNVKIPQDRGRRRI